MTTFAKESDLCQAFIAALPANWTAYPETGGFDILLSRADGFQIGVEAKLKLNAKVILQAAEDCRRSYVAMPGPDCRAVLVPEAHNRELAELCRLLCVTVVVHRPREPGVVRSPIWPDLPTATDQYWNEVWHELAPARRLDLPEWVPDVAAGASAPIALTDWKIRAIKIVVTLEKRGFVTRQDFSHFKISMSRWTQGRWLVQDGRGGWVAGQYLPDFRAQHPVNFPQIEADYDKWRNPAEPVRAPKQEALL
ncbi:hypothetical protein ACFFTN_01275 [Aminobacter aganoensis]|uniref:Uncharacterized protein n=1 Tax=Aminobacter aganoensis TaxID=83264 RepID=A0A7X0F5M9_9HYPH|nr:hypothetical protein [Aminobacter aganoensis]MBB6353510.1 hypothetical protein [Aminobacter aganoensis]